MSSNRRDYFRQIVALLPDTARFRFLQISDHEITETRFNELGTALSQSVRRGELSRRAFMKIFGIVGAGGLWSLLFPHRSEAWQTWTGFWQNTQNNPAATYTGPDPYWDYVTLLLQFDGANGSTLFPDESNVGKAPTINGAPYIDTSAGSSPYSGRTGSAKFNGSTDYISYSDSSDWTFGAGNFSIELWVNPASLPATNGVYYPLVTQWATGQFGFGIGLYNSSGTVTLNCQVSTSGTAWTSSSVTTIGFSAGSWHHIAFVRNGSSLTTYIDGASTGSIGSVSGTIFDSTASVQIGFNNYSGSYFPGSLSDLRIYKGVAKYTANFTPRTAPIGLGSYSDPYWGYCVLACPFDSSLKDCSGKKATASGSAALSSTTKKYGSASASFDGSTSYINIPDSTDLDLGTSDFTIEAFINPSTASGASNVALSKRATTSVHSPFLLVNTTVFWARFTDNTTAVTNISGTTTISTGTWYHVAFVRNGNTVSLFVNGTQEASATISGAILLNTSSLTVGANAADGSTPFSGYIDSLRITKGYARYVANFIPPTAGLPVGKDESIDPFWSSTVLAMHMDDLMDATGRHATSLNGTASIVSSPGRFGSGYLNSPASSGLNLGNSADWSFSNGDFTIETFASSTDWTGSNKNIISRSSGSPNTSWGLRVDSGKVEFYCSTDGSNWLTPVSVTYSLPTSQWVHFAVSKQGQTVRIFIDGNQIGSGTLSSAIFAPSINTYAATFACALDDLRITKGIARYVQSFAPPTRAFATVASTATTPSIVTSGLVANLDAGDSASLVSATSGNLISYSEQFDHTFWSKLNSVSISGNTVTAPDGSLTADKFIENSDSTHKAIAQLCTIPQGATFTVSVFVKSAERTQIMLHGRDSGYTNRFGAFFELSTGTITSDVGGSGTLFNSGMTAVANGWYRIWVTGTTGAANTQGLFTLYLTSAGSLGYAGNGTSGLYIWGAQLEVSTSATPYVRTPATTANLLKYSEQLNNTSTWTPWFCTVTADAATAPDGFTTAEKLAEDNTNNAHALRQSYTVANATQYTFSCYLKAAERNFVGLEICQDGTNYGAATFNLSNGTVAATGGSIYVSSSIQSAANGFYRCSVTVLTNALGSSSYVDIRLANSASNIGVLSYTGTTGSGAYIWGAQLEVGTSATAYIPTITSSASRYSSPQTWTNLLTYSEQADNAAWTKTASSVSADQATAPDGTVSGDKVMITTANSQHTVRTAGLTLIDNTSYTISVFAKAGEKSSLGIEFQTKAGTYTSAIFDLSAGTIPASTAGATIQVVGSGWYRCSYTVNAGSGGSTPYAWFHITNTTSSLAGYAGANNTDGLYLWGAQLEQASEPGPYILTTSASASFTGTRAWRNTVESPADGSSPTAYDFQFGGTLSSAAPTPYAVSGGKSANDLIQFDGNDLLATRSIPSFVQNIHKANAKYTIEFAGRGFPLSSGSPTILSSMGGGTTNPDFTGFEILARFGNLQLCGYKVWNAASSVWYCDIPMTSSGFWHIAISVDAQSGQYAWISNGKTSSGSMSYSSPATADSLNRLEIGRTKNTGFLESGTQLYFVRLYNRALTTTELTQNWNATRGRYGL